MIIPSQMMNGSNFLLILCCFIVGMALRRWRVMPENAHIVLNRFIIYVSLPALTIPLVHDLHVNQNAVYPILMPWILFLMASAFFVAMGKALKWNIQTVGALILTAGLGNTSFLGYPLIETFYGKQALSIGVLTDQPGSFSVLSTLGIFAASACAGTDFRIGAVLRRVLLFPPFIAAILGFASRSFTIPQIWLPVLGRLGDTLVPFALVSVGMQLTLDRESLRREIGHLTAGLTFKLLAGPALIALLYFWIFGARGQEIEISVFQAAMAPMITGGILAAENELNPKLASLMIGIGIPLSLITVPAWWWVLQRLALV